MAIHPADDRSGRPAAQPALELLQLLLLSFRHNLDHSVPEVAHIPAQAETTGLMQRRISKTNSLDSAIDAGV